MTIILKGHAIDMMAKMKANFCRELFSSRQCTETESLLSSIIFILDTLDAGCAGPYSITHNVCRLSLTHN